MLGLEWKDICFETGVINIRRTSNYTAERGIYTDTTKTKRSQRFVKVPMEIIALLKEFKAEQDEERERTGDKWVETDRLYVKWNGEPMNNQTPYWWLQEFCEKHNLPFYGLHTFRHPNAMETFLCYDRERINENIVFALLIKLFNVVFYSKTEGNTF